MKVKNFVQTSCIFEIHCCYYQYLLPHFYQYLVSHFFSICCLIFAMKRNTNLIQWVCEQNFGELFLFEKKPSLTVNLGCNLEFLLKGST